MKYHTDPAYREQVLAKQRERRKNFTVEQREHDQAVKREYRRTHAEQMREVKRRWIRAHPEYREVENRRRREREARMRVEEPEKWEALRERRNMLARLRRARKREG